MFQNNFSGYNIEFYTEFFLLIIIWKKIKATTTDFCTFCKEESETIQHVFANWKHIVLFGVNSVGIFYKTLEKELFFMFIIIYLVKLLLAKLTKLWILSCYIQNKTFIYVWNKKEYQLCVSLYIFLSLNTKSKNMPQFKNYSFQLLKNGGQHGKICFYLIKRDRVFKVMQIYHIFRFKYAMVWMKVWKKSASIKNNSNLCVTCTFIYVYL